MCRERRIGGGRRVSGGEHAGTGKEIGSFPAVFELRRNGFEERLGSSSTFSGGARFDTEGDMGLRQFSDPFQHSKFTSLQLMWKMTFEVFGYK